MAKKSKVEVETVAVLEPGAAETKLIALSAITGNSAQARGMGVLSNLAEKGYGVFSKGSDEEKEPIWDMLFGKPEDRKEAVHLIEENESGPSGSEEKHEEARSKSFVRFAEKMAKTGQLQAIGVRMVDGGGYDIIYGARRALAMAYNHTRDGDQPNEILASIYSSDLSPVALKEMSIQENDAREDQSPIDRAMSYQWLQKHGSYTPDKIGTKVGRSGQSIRNHLKLLSPLLAEQRFKIHTRQMSIERALLLYDKKKKSDKDVDESEVSSRNGEHKKERFRIQSSKVLIKLYDTERKPKKMEQEEWDLLTLPDVRKYLAYKLGLKYSEYKEPPPEEAKPEKAPKAKKEKSLGVKKATAIHLLVALGKTNARTWSEEKIVESLEAIVNVQESPEQTVETTKLQKLLNRLRLGYTEVPQLKVKLLKEEKE